MKIKLEKVSREKVSFLEDVLRCIFQDNVLGVAVDGFDFEDTNKKIPFDNRKFNYSLGNSTAEYTAFSQNGSFSLILQLNNLSVSIQTLFLEQIKDKFPEIYSLFNNEYHK